jgi:hypothetical protein
MADIVDELRAQAHECYGLERQLMLDAAIEIEKLRAVARRGLLRELSDHRGERYIDRVRTSDIRNQMLELGLIEGPR